MDKLEEVRDSVVVFGKRGQGWGCKVQKPRHRKQGRPVRICHVYVTWQSSTGQWAHCITNKPPTTVDWLADARFLGSICFPTKAERSTAAILVIIKVIPFPLNPPATVACRFQRTTATTSSPDTSRLDQAIVFGTPTRVHEPQQHPLCLQFHTTKSSRWVNRGSCSRRRVHTARGPGDPSPATATTDECFAHRQELVQWLNSLLQLNITKVEQCGTGYVVDAPPLQLSSRNTRD